ncbi:Mucin-5B [Lonchura striata]|uniref:Mucin-5B n=1 Tax=Lonchura striata TaxID=40157 RepID=A0A218UYF4_9PASE|nr:Mucin-5B [Lonchura striata domestica]
MPFSLKSILIEDTCTYFQVTSKLGLTLKWNWADTLLLDLEETYKEKICGLCGNYDGNEKNDLILDGYKMHPRQFGNFHKVEDPSQKCTDVSPDDHTGRHPRRKDNRCNSYKKGCKKLMSRFGNCPRVVAFDDYIETCAEDMCHCAVNSSHSDLVPSCICSTLNQYSRDCVLRKGDPGEWRTKELCYQECPNNMEYMECGNSCADTCADPERSKICKAPCTDGCFCPPGTILDDLSSKKCIPRDSCPCTFQGKVYSSGGTYSTPCQNCTCKGGHWSCISLPCSGSCHIDGGFHITTFDNKRFNFHGNCHYVLAKNTDDTVVVIGEIIQCGTSRTMTCLKNVLVTLGRTTIKICSCGNIYMNNFIVKLPVKKDDITIFRQSTFFIQILSSAGVQIRVQMKPVMQLSITVDHSFQNRTSGLCGNFNNIQTDDFRTVTGAVEDSASAFGNSWKTRASCFDVEDSFEDPCSNSVDKEKFAQHWCALLSNTSSVFAACHSVVDPSVYIKKCMYDTCNAEKSEVALCSVLSTYSRDCASAGVSLQGWRQGVCDPSEECPETMVYNYSVKYCNQSCRSLGEPDLLCQVRIAPMEGCACPEGTYLNDEEECVAPDDCPCYYKGKIVQPGNSFQEDKLMCKCIQGRLDCIGETVLVKDCPAPMYYFNCSSAGPRATGSECQKSCKTQDMHCVRSHLPAGAQHSMAVHHTAAGSLFFLCTNKLSSPISSNMQYVTECVSGCMCPDGLVLDGSGGCIPKDQCPCVHGGHFYKPGETIKVDCNTCTCNKRQWNCTDNPCKGTCTVYGNGHYMSFDGEKFDFLGDCDYILAQDFCPNNMDAGTFRIVIQNNACGKSRSICSLKITLIFENSEIRLLEGRIQEIATDPGAEKNYKVDLRGGYIVIETNQGMNFMWDQKTTVVVHVAPSFQGKVCGLCGDFDGRTRNDFTTRGQSMEMSIQEFGNSWKITSTCSNINLTDLCVDQPFKSALGQKHCSIIKSSIFEDCHSKVNPIPYYESCVSDFCGCDSVGDCECFCTSVAAYSRSCSRAGVCINWRTPAICRKYRREMHTESSAPCAQAPGIQKSRTPPLLCIVWDLNVFYSSVLAVFCDYYNPPDKHEWFYKPCGAPCLRTCRNPQGKCGNLLYSLEGNFSLTLMQFMGVTKNALFNFPGCYPECSPDKPYFDEESRECVSLLNCTSCDPEEKLCAEDSKVCLCCYNGKTYTLNETVYSHVYGTKCSEAVCGPNGQIIKTLTHCGTPSTPAQGTRLIRRLVFNETWNFGNCHTATCLGEGNNIKLSVMTCPPQQQKLCVNGFPFTKHSDETGCCEVSECQCICSGWGNEHYVTFDGAYYHFKENCTYVLVKSIHPDSHNFWINVDNYYCAATGGATCSMSLIIFYSNSIVILTQAMEHGKEINLILFDNKKVVPDIFKNGIRITSSGLYAIIEIPELEVYISYSRLAFYIKLPFSKFYNNTMGLCGECPHQLTKIIALNFPPYISHSLAKSLNACNFTIFRKFIFILLPGTCTNQKSDDAMKRNGEVVNSFKEMALDWKAPYPTNRYCSPGVSLPSKIEYHQHCVPSNLCKIIWTLTECHGVVPPQPYYEACVASGCSEEPRSSECQSMQTYAALCGLHGVCADWRSLAGGRCAEGAPGSGLFNLCVAMLHRGQLSSGSGVQAMRGSKKKHLLQQVGHFLLETLGNMTANTVLLCLQVTLLDGMLWLTLSLLSIAECDIKTCIINKTVCDLGFQPVVAMSEDGCCPVFSCIPKGVCVSEGVEFKPGAMVPKSSCENCVCMDEQDPMTQTNRIQCLPVQCQTTCQQGFRYVEEKGQCCSQCQQVACVANFPFGNVTIEVGKSYKDPYDNCTQYTCTESAGQFSLTSIIKVCLPFEEANCVPGTVEVSSDGCCKTCIDLPHKCKRNVKEQYIVHGNCKSAAPVPVPFCEGMCSTYSVFFGGQ